MSHDTVVIYHASCPDGAVSAWAFTQATRMGKSFGKLKFHYTNERDFTKDARMPKLIDKDVYIVDYCYPRNVLEQINLVAKSLHVYDHHKTSIDMFITNHEEVSLGREAVYEIPHYCVFDLTRCGAEITWDELYGYVSRPWFIKHIRDRDLWLWEDPNSRAFSAVVHERGLGFEVFDGLLTESSADIYSRGTLIDEIANRNINVLCSFAELVMFEGYPVYALDSILLRSECGNILAEKPDGKFSFVYRYRVVEDEWWVSLRGIKENNIDLTVIAKKYGGGGHPLASGFVYRGNLTDILKPLPQSTGFTDE